MPVIKVRALPDPTRDITRAATEVGAAIARAAGIAPAKILVEWSDIAPGHYVVDGVAPTSQPAETHPPLVEISSNSGRSLESREALMRAAADAVAQQVGVSVTNVRVVYTEAPPGWTLGRGRIH